MCFLNYKSEKNDHGEFKNSALGDFDNESNTTDNRKLQYDHPIRKIFISRKIS